MRHKPPSSTTSPRRPGSPTCSPASPIIPPPGSMSCCHGVGKRPRITPPRHDHSLPRCSADGYGVGGGIRTFRKPDGTSGREYLDVGESAEWRDRPLLAG